MTLTYHLGTNIEKNKIYEIIFNLGFSDKQYVEGKLSSINHESINGLGMQIHPDSPWFRNAPLKYKHHLEFMDTTEKKPKHTKANNILKKMIEYIPNLIYDTTYHPEVIKQKNPRELIPLGEYISSLNK